MTITDVCCHKKLTTSIQRKLAKEGVFRPFQLDFSKIADWIDRSLICSVAVVAVEHRKDWAAREIEWTISAEIFRQRRPWGGGREVISQ